MDVFLLSLIVLCIVGIRLAPKRTVFNEKYLDTDHTNALRGLLCVLIVLDHSSLLTGCGYSVVFLKRVGPYVVALFYLLSSYGLMASYVKNGFKLKGFWKKRFFGTILPYLLFYIAAIMLRLALKEKLTLTSILLSFVNGHPLVVYSWFVITIIIFYVVFYFSALLAKRDATLLTVLVGFLLFFFVFVMKKLGFEEFWFNAAWAFPLGMLWNRVYPRISASFRNHPWVYLSIFGSISIWWIIIAERFFWFGYLARLCSTMSLCVFILLFMFKIKIGNPILNFFGKISLGIYMSHGLIATALPKFLSPEEQPYLFVALLVAGSILLAWLFDLGYGRLKKRVV